MKFALYSFDPNAFAEPLAKLKAAGIAARACSGFAAIDNPEAAPAEFHIILPIDDAREPDLGASLALAHGGDVVAVAGDGSDAADIFAEALDKAPEA